MSKTGSLFGPPSPFKWFCGLGFLVSVSEAHLKVLLLCCCRDYAMEHAKDKGNHTPAHSISYTHTPTNAFPVPSSAFIPGWAMERSGMCVGSSFLCCLWPERVQEHSRILIPWAFHLFIKSCALWFWSCMFVTFVNFPCGRGLKFCMMIWMVTEQSLCGQPLFSDCQTEVIFGSQHAGCVSVFGSVHRECLLISQVVIVFPPQKRQACFCICYSAMAIICSVT